MSLEGKVTAMQKVRGKISRLPHIPSIDKSLSVEGYAADAKAVGDAIAAIEGGVDPTSVLPIANGGTGATTADAARENIGAAATAHGHAIADVSGLQSALNAKANASAVPTKLSQLTNDVGFKTTDNDTNTTYSLSKTGNTITLTGSDGSKTSVEDASGSGSSGGVTDITSQIALDGSNGDYPIKKAVDTGSSIVILFDGEQEFADINLYTLPEAIQSKLVVSAAIDGVNLPVDADGLLGRELSLFSSTHSGYGTTLEIKYV